MANILPEITIILGLIFANGIFSATEIAVISVRKSLLNKLIEEDNYKAKLVDKLQTESSKFFATIQIGITLLSTFASAFGGASLVNNFASIFEKVSFLKPFSSFLGLATVIILISYLSLIFGELVPKALASRYPLKISLFTASFISLILKIFSPFVKFLSLSTNAILKLLGITKKREHEHISEDEIKWLIQEGREKGIFNPTEQELIQSVFTFSDTLVKEVMTPRFKIQAIPLASKKKEILKILSESGLARFPVYRKDLDHIVGILINKDVFKLLISSDKEINLEKIILPPLFVPETQKISQVLKRLQKEHQNMSIIVDEYGNTEGLVTIEDLVEELVGEIRDETDQDEMKEMRKIGTNTYIVDGSFPIKDLKEDYLIHLPDSPDYETIAGFLLKELQTLPSKGKKYTYENCEIEILAVENNRISKVKITKNLKPAQSSKKANC